MGGVCVWGRGYVQSVFVCAGGVYIGGVYHTAPDREEDTLLWTEWLAHACENITLPQTSFAGGNYIFYLNRQQRCPIC